MSKEQSNRRLFDKVFGALMGFAIGDAMGATTEFMSSDEIKERYGSINCIRGGGWLNLEPGEVTDDTQMMIAVARAYIYALDEPNFSEAYLDGCCNNFSIWYVERPKDIGNTCRQAIATCMGKPHQEWIDHAKKVNEAYPSLGNGSLMRCLFPALVGDVPAAVGQGLLTHNNPVVTSIIASYARLIKEYLNSTTTKSRPAPALCLPTGTVENTFQNAVYWSCAPDFRAAILGAVNDGGDADTIAALTGGLAGARFGFTKIPASWVSQMNEEVYIIIRTLAEKALEIIAEEDITE